MDIGYLREGYLSNLEEYPDDEEKIFVMRGRGNDELAPSEELLSDFKELEEKHDNRWKAWNLCNYESRFKEEMRREESQERMEEIAEKVADGKDVRLICYEKDPPCHRVLLVEMIGNKITRIITAPL